MKLKTEIRLLLRLIPGRLRAFAGVLLLLVFPFFSSAQVKTFHFQNTPLSEALSQVANSLKLSVSFDAKAMSERMISGSFSYQEPLELFTKLLLNSGYKADFKFGNFLIIPDNKPKPAQIIQYIDVSGVLTDEQTGEQLPYATIFLPEPGSYLSSTVNGTFSFRVRETPAIRIQIQYMGYRPVDTTLVVTGNRLTVSCKLKPRQMELAPIQVKQNRVQMIDQNKDASHSTVNPVGFVNLPSMGENDIFRTVQLLPGVGYAEGSSGLNIRGGTADQNLILFDGFTLYNLDHFFGTFSSVNPSVVKDIQILKGGFDARYGERLSGIVDITGKTGNKYKPRFNAGLNLISGTLETELPLSEKLTLVAAARRSYADIYKSFLVHNLVENRMEDAGSTLQSGTSIMQLQPGYYFYDYNGKLTYSKNENEKMSVSVFGGKDFLSSAGEGRNRQTYSSTTDKNNWVNYGFSYSWIKQWHKKFFSGLQIGYSGYLNDYQNETTVNSRVKTKKVVVGTFDSYEKNELNDFSASLKNQLTIGLKNTIDFGFQAKYNEFAYLKSEDTDAYYSDIANSSWLNSSYFQINSQLIKNLTLKAGSRISYYNLSSKIYYEPRFSGNYQLGSFLKFKFAAGRYYQFLSKVTPTQAYGYNRDFWVIADGSNHPVLSSDHLIGGTTASVNRFTFDVETYYKTSNNLQVFLYIPQYQKNTNPNSFVNKGQAKKLLPSKFITGTGKSVGVDFLLKYESPVYTGWISYSRSKSIRNFADINQGEDIPAPFDRSHEIKWVNLFSWRNWNFSALWLYSTGQPYVLNQTVDGTLVARFTYERLPNYKRLDVSANYNLHIKRLVVRLGASLINCLNQNNFNDIYSRDFNFDTTTFTETTFVKSLGRTPNFYINFQY